MEEKNSTIISDVLSQTNSNPKRILKNYLITIILGLLLLSAVAGLLYQMRSSKKELVATKSELTVANEQIASLEKQITSLKNEISKLKEVNKSEQTKNTLSSSKEYLNWVASQTAVEPYDLYNDLKYAYQQFSEYHDNYYIGTEKYNAALKLLVPTSNQQDVDGYLWKLNRYFSKDQNTSTQAFVDDLVSVGLLTEVSENSYSWNREELNKSNVVAKLNVTNDVAEGLLGLLRTCDWDV